MNRNKRWLDPNDLEKEFGISKSTQAKLRMNRRIPYIKMTAKHIRYDRYDIEVWLENKKVTIME